MGESGSGRHPEVAGKLGHAGFDKRLSVRARRAWFRRSARVWKQMPFDQFFTVAVESLSEAFKGGHDDLGFCDTFRTMLMKSGHSKCKGEFNAKQSLMGEGAGHSPPNVFPLPAFPPEFLGQMLGGSALGALRSGGNLVLLALNWLHGGRCELMTSLVTAAHRRIFTRVGNALRALVMTDEPVMGPEGLDHYMRQTQLYTGSGVVLALGVKGGVPDKAADVPLGQHLQELFPEMAEQVNSPSHLLLPLARRPRRVKRGFTCVAPSYPELVKKNVKAGLQKLKHPKQVARLGGKTILAGGEDRVITDPTVNQLLDPERLPRPRFAYVPSLRSVTVPRAGLIVVSKRDARHYFHRLRIGGRWWRWLCSPPIIDLPCRQGGT